LEFCLPLDSSLLNVSQLSLSSAVGIFSLMRLSYDLNKIAVMEVDFMMKGIIQM
jgi:hypothetical protein